MKWELGKKKHGLPLIANSGSGNQGTQEAAKYGLAAPTSLFCYFVFRKIINLPSAFIRV